MYLTLCKQASKQGGLPPYVTYPTYILVILLRTVMSLATSSSSSVFSVKPARRTYRAKRVTCK